MSTHTIVGAGAVGSGTGPTHPSIELVAADAGDASRLSELTAGAHALYNCANPPYHEWATAWPPLAASFIAAAEATGARLVTMSNLYGFARHAGPMKATDPLAPHTRKGRIRTDMWQNALRAHEEGRIQATEARASDYFGPGLGETSHLGDRAVPRALAGKTVSMVGSTDVIHSWSYIADVCVALATLGTDDRSLGRAWHVPTLPAVTATDMVNGLCDAAGVDRVKVKRIPGFALRAAGLFSPVVRELLEMRYQFDEPFVIDATDTTEVFGIEATLLDAQFRATVDSYREVPASRSVSR